MNTDTSITHREDKDEKKLIFAFCYFVAFETVDGLINRLLNVAIWDSLFTKGLLYGSMALGVWVALKRFKPAMLTLPALITVFFLASYFFFPYNHTFLIGIIPQFFLLGTVPMIFITSAIKDWNRLYLALRPTAMVVIICAVIYLPIKAAGIVQLEYLSFSYQIMFSVIFMMFLSMREKGLVNIAFTVAGVFCIVALGGRGPLVGVLLGVAVYVLANFKISTGGIIATLFALIAGTVIWSQFNNVLLATESLLSRYGIYSRTIRSMLQEEFFVSSGRVGRWNVSLMAIKNQWFFGYGMGGDRFVLGSAGEGDRYAHNIFVEMVMQYGVFLGGLMLVLILYLIFKNITAKQKDGLFFIGLVSIFSTGFFGLNFSGSYLHTPMFFIMLVLCYKISKQKNTAQEHARVDSYAEKRLKSAVT